MTQSFFQFNNSIIDEISNFATSTLDLLFISGPKGSSKSEIIQKVIDELSLNNLIFQHFCFENTTINDFLLNFYDEFRNFSLSQRIFLKKFPTNDFKEKVSHYFKTINSKCIIIVENFEKSESNIEIIDFLSHLASYPNVKIIILSRNSDKNLFRFKKIRIKNIQSNSLLKSDFKQKFIDLYNSDIQNLKNENLNEDFYENFYNITQGLELYLKMSIKYCFMAGVGIQDLVGEYERRIMNASQNYEEFMVSKFTTLTPKVYLGLFKVLCSIRHPINLEFLNEYKIGNFSNNFECIDYLTKNFLISRFKDEIYVKDYFRQYIIRDFSIQEQIDCYSSLIEIYENELTKSPKDRLLRLSRESIRKEIDLLNSIIPSVETRSAGAFAYLGMADGNTKIHSGEQKKSKLHEHFKKSDKIPENSDYDTESQDLKKLLLYKQKSENRKSLITDLINQSKELTKNYKYKAAVDILQQAKEKDYNGEFRIEILLLCAKNQELLNDWSSGKDLYKEALEYAKNVNDLRICEIEFLIATANKNLFKIEKALKQFLEIANNKTYSKFYRAKAYLEAAEIEEADSNFDISIEYCNMALDLSPEENIELVCTGYYKLAFLYDQIQNFDEAVKYYKKNYLMSSNKEENKYYSISLTNLALIYSEQSKYVEASEFLRLALDFDSKNNDLENMYFSQKELAKLYTKIDLQTAIDYYKKALESAKTLKDSFREALVYFEMGDLYYYRQEDKKALENFLNAKKVLKNNPKDENVTRIDSRIKDIKIRLSDADFSAIMEQYAE